MKVMKQISESQPTTNSTFNEAFPVGKPEVATSQSTSLRAATVSDISSLSLSTQSLHADDSLNKGIDDVAPPIHVSTTFRYPKNPDHLRPLHERDTIPILESTEHVYSRQSTHSTSRLEKILSVLMKHPCVTYSSGLAAFYALLHLIHPKRVCIGAGYHGCHGTLDLYERLTGCKILPLDAEPDEIGEGDLIHLETPVNPTGLAFDIQHYADKAHARGAYLSVDSTFAPPPLQDPFRHGADIVMHSGTKYIGGHSDLLCGILVVNRIEWLNKLLDDRLFLGSVMGGLEGWLGIRSIRTLELRVLRQSETATVIVAALNNALAIDNRTTGLPHSDAENIKAVLKEVHHSSLQVTDRKTWLTEQMPKGFGPVFSIVMKSSVYAKRLPSKLKLFYHATSLGGVESLIEWRTMTDSTVKKDLLRVSIGLEDAKDLLDDLLQGFRALAQETNTSSVVALSTSKL